MKEVGDFVYFYWSRQNELLDLEDYFKRIKKRRFSSLFAYFFFLLSSLAHNFSTTVLIEMISFLLDVGVLCTLKKVSHINCRYRLNFVSSIVIKSGTKGAFRGEASSCS